MENLYYLEYGCSICTEHLIVLAKSLDEANEFAYQEAQNVYYSYDYNYPANEDCEDMDEDDIAEMMQEEMECNISYSAVPYDPKNEDHVAVFTEQENKPFKI